MNPDVNLIDDVFERCTIFVLNSIGSLQLHLWHIVVEKVSEEKLRGTWLFHYRPFFLLCKFGTRQGMEEGSRGIQQYNLDEGMQISFMICESDLIFKQNTFIKFVFIKLYKTISVLDKTYNAWYLAKIKILSIDFGLH